MQHANATRECRQANADTRTAAFDVCERRKLAASKTQVNTTYSPCDALPHCPSSSFSYAQPNWGYHTISLQICVPIVPQLFPIDFITKFDESFHDFGPQRGHVCPGLINKPVLIVQGVHCAVGQSPCSESRVLNRTGMFRHVASRHCVNDMTKMTSNDSE